MCLSIDPTLPDATDGIPCCEGYAYNGPGACTCWTERYDLDQTDPDPTAVRLLAAGIEPTAQRTRCGDCAYRPGSPEMRGDPTHVGDATTLDELAALGDRFWCHQGMRRTTALVHPSGVEIPGHSAAYRPPIIAGIPYQADGQPGLLCAGWVARSRKWEALTNLALAEEATTRG
jgi:hypothetical protein